MRDRLREFCEENNIECVVERKIDELVRISMMHRPTGNSFCKLYWNLDDSAIESTTCSAKEIFNLVDVASLYPKLPEDVVNYCRNDVESMMRFYKYRQRTDSKRPEIENVIFNDPATIVFWSDGTKTVVKAANEIFDPEKGLAMAVAKKFLGNRGNYYNVFKEWLPEEKVPTIPKLNINWTDETKVILTEPTGGSVDDSLHNLASKILFAKNIVDEPTAKVTYRDIYTEFRSNYPDFADDVEDWRPYFPPYTKIDRPMNIVIWLRNGETKRYSYETKRLYPVVEE